ncbi:CPBP family intramembrane metalloprotease [Pseudidiomarina salinarum]|nr:CPBP family intramembrane metalloprotease [Pseudidiomarina salinarum]
MLLAILISSPFRFGLADWPIMDAHLFGVPVLRALLEGSGPIIAVLVVTVGLRQYWQPVTFTGGSTVHALLMLLTAPVVFTLIGVPNAAGISPHWFGLALGSGTIIYCLFEEAGWRGFLQNALQSWSPVRRYVLVGVLWYLWHLGFLAEGATWANQLMALAVLIGGSFLLGKLADETHAVAVTAAFHLVVNILVFNSLARDVPVTDKLLLIAACVVLWVPILIHWKRTRPVAQL